MRSLFFAALALTVTFSTAACSSSDVTAASDDAVVSRSASALQTYTSDSNGFDTHSFWLDTGREVVVFDAQFTVDYANKLIAEIKAKTSSPIRWVVVTHPNPDKFNGAPAFQAIGAKVVASSATAAAIPGVHAYKKYYFVNVAKSFTDETYPAQATIDQTFDGDYSLPLQGKVTVKLHELRHRGVSSTQTVAFIPESNSLVVGDLVHSKTHAWLEGGIIDGKPVPDLPSWAQALDELSVYKDATVYGGRGQTAVVDSAVKEEQAYLSTMNGIVTQYVSSLGANAVSELAGPNSGTDYKAIGALAAKAFPDYALEYMIEYGVYGLANQIAAVLAGSASASDGTPGSDAGAAASGDPNSN